MISDIATQPISERFKHLQKLICSKRFLKSQGLGNEVPFFICPYKSKEAVEMTLLQKQLVNKLSQSGIKVLEINLYDLSVDILKKNEDWEWYLEKRMA